MERKTTKGTRIKHMSPPYPTRKGVTRSIPFLRHKIADLLWGVTLIGLIGFFVFTLDLSRQETRENRNLEPFPAFIENCVPNKQFAASFENYISDRLWMRDWMIDIHGKILSVFDHRGNQRVLVGDDGWLFGNFGGNSHNFEMLAYYQRKVSFNAVQLEKIKSDLRRVKEWAAARGMTFYVYFPPDKQTIYKEYYPSFINVSDKPTLVSKVEEFIKDEINVISLEDEFLKHRHDDLLHYKTESHWSPSGGCLAYRLIMKRLEQDFPNLKALDNQDISVNPTAEVISAVYPNGKRRIYKGNLYDMLGKPNYIDVYEPLYKKYTFKYQAQIQTDSFPPFETSFNKLGQNLRVYVVGDSYTDYIMPFMAATFKDVRKVRINQGEAGIRFNSRAPDIAAFKPHVLLLGISDLKMIELLKIW